MNSPYTVIIELHFIPPNLDTINPNNIVIMPSKPGLMKAQFGSILYTLFTGTLVTLLVFLLAILLMAATS